MCRPQQPSTHRQAHGRPRAWRPSDICLQHSHSLSACSHHKRLYTALLFNLKQLDTHILHEPIATTRQRTLPRTAASQRPHRSTQAKAPCTLPNLSPLTSTATARQQNACHTSNSTLARKQQILEQRTPTKLTCTSTTLPTFLPSSCKPDSPRCPHSKKAPEKSL